MIELARTPAAPEGTVASLPAEATPEEALPGLRHLAERGLGPGWAGLFATPRREGGTLVWETEGTAAKRYFDLPAEERAAVRASLGAALSETRRAAEREEASALELLRGAIEVPGWESVHLVDGRPVIAPWGLRPSARAPGASPLASLDDGRPARPKSLFPWPAVLTTLGALALLAVLALLFLRWWAPWLAAPVTTACRAEPGGFAALAALLDEEGRGQGLGAELARLQGEYGRRQSECPIAELPPEPPPPPPRPAPPPPPVRPPDAQPCDVEAQSGGRGVTRNRHFLGNQPGRVTIDYNMLIEPDHLEVRYRGQQLATTNIPVSGRGRLAFDWRPTGSGPEAHVVEVIVSGFGLTTRWSYTIGCPR